MGSSSPGASQVSERSMNVIKSKAVSSRLSKGGKCNYIYQKHDLICVERSTIGFYVYTVLKHSR